MTEAWATTKRETTGRRVIYFQATVLESELLFRSLSSVRYEQRGLRGVISRNSSDQDKLRLLSLSEILDVGPEIITADVLIMVDLEMAASSTGEAAGIMIRERIADLKKTGGCKISIFTFARDRRARDFVDPKFADYHITTNAEIDQRLEGQRFDPQDNGRFMEKKMYAITAAGTSQAFYAYHDEMEDEIDYNTS